MNSSDFDLNLLLAFEALWLERHVTRAGSRLNVGQATMSNMLKRLRKQCGDPLFVRAGGGMVPTPCAQALAQAILPALDTIKNRLAHPDQFNPRSSDRSFTLLMSDISQFLVLPRLSVRLNELAPHVSLRVGKVQRSEYRMLLERGDADLAIGHLHELQTGFYQEGLFNDHHVCVAGRKFRPRDRQALTQEEYLAGRHLVVSSSKTDEFIDQLLARQGLMRDVALEVPSYLVLSEILRDSSFIVTVSSVIALSLCGAGEIGYSRLPFAVPPINVRQFWHSRNHVDPANQWLRRQVLELNLESHVHRER